MAEIYDFGWLSQLPQSYMQGRDYRQRMELDRAFKNGLPRASDGSVDYNAAVDIAARAGGLNALTKIAPLANNSRDFAFRVGEAQRAQRNADRAYGLQERTANTAQIVNVEGSDGSKYPVRVDREGRASKIDIPGAATSSGNPFLTGKAGTEGQQNAQLYANRMFAAEKVLRSVETAGTSWWDRMKGRASDYSGYNMRSPEYQKFDQAQRDFINAVLRRESGAVISEAEFDNANKQYFPQPGDDTATIAQKRRNRMEAIKGIGAAGGPAYRPPATFGQGGEIVPFQPQQQSQGITQEQYNALPPGSQYTAPDGTVRTKR